MIQITCINNANGNHENPHTAISHLGWKDVNTGEYGKNTRLEIYDFVLSGQKAYVASASGEIAYLMTAETYYGTKYVKTIPDSTKTDNLLELPECIS